MEISTAFHPQTDGQTDRVHQILAQIFHTLLFHKQPELWAEKLPYAKISLNSATNATSKKLVLELLYKANVVFSDSLDIGTENTHFQVIDLATKVQKPICAAQEQVAKSWLA